MERIAGWSATHRMTVVIGWLLLVAAVFAGGHVVSATNVPSYDSGQSGRAEQTLNRLNVTFPPAESVLIQSRAPGRTLAGDPELRQATREAVAALRALPRSATDIRSPLSPGGRSLVETVQPPYHLFRRDIEADLLPYAQAHHIGVLAYGPLAHGLLGGTITEATTFGADDWRSQARRSPGPGFQHNLQVVAALRRFAADRGATIAQLAVVWVLAHPAVQVAIVGSRTPAYLTESIGALDLTLSQGDLAEIDCITAAAAPLGGPTPEGMT